MARDAIFADHPDPIWVVCKASGRILAANRAACRLYGYCEEAFQRMAFAALECEAAPGQPDGARYHRLSDGRCVPVQVDRESTEWKGRDAEIVIARHRAPQLSRRLMQTLESLSDPFVLLDPDLSVAFMNGEAIRLFKKLQSGTPDPFQGFTQGGLPLHRHFTQALETGARVTAEACAPGSAGRFFVNAYPTGDGLAVHVQDITENRAQKDQIRLFDNAMSRLKDIVMITEVSPIDAPFGPRIVWVNDAFERNTGFSREEALGKTPRILQGPDTQRDVLDRIRAALERQAPVSAELVNYRKDGTPIWLEIDIVPFSNDSGGEITHFIATQRDITDRKHAQAALCESETRFQLVAKAANEVIFDYDVVNDRVWWNEAMQAIFGHPLEDHNNSLSFWTQMIHPDDLPANYQSLMRAFEGDSDTWVGEYRFRRADGSYANVVDRGLILRDADGNPLRWVGSMIDVTALRESEQNFRLAAKAAKDVIFVYDFATDSHWWSEAIHTHYGHAAAIDGGTLEDWLELVHPDDRARVSAAHEDAAESDQETWSAHYRLMRADGRYAHVIDRKFFIRDSEGRPQRSIGSIVDVTQIREDEMRFRAVAQVATDAIYDYDPLRQIIHYSQGMQELFGHAWQGAHKQAADWYDHIAEGDRDTVRQGYENFIAGCDEQAQFEYRLRRTDGTFATVEEKAVALRDSDGRATRIIGSIRDVSIARQMEERLRQSQKLEAMGHMTGGVAHDFNNLLTIMMGNAELLAESPSVSPVHRGMARSVVTAAERGAGLVNSLLAFARRQPLDARPVDLHELCEELACLLERTLPANVETHIQPAPDLWLAQADPAQLTTALINLALNARDAMPRGGTLVIRCENMALNESEAQRLLLGRPGEYLAISVIDTGSGMSRKVRERAFDPFFTTKPPGRGSGMGLSMVYGFARQSGGHAQIQSEPGMGTTVSIYLPRSNECGRVDSGADAREAFPLGRGEHVLVVEDDAMLRDHVQATIAGLGYRVSVAANAAEALAVLRSQPGISLLFSDIVMPGDMDGRALARAARKEFPSLQMLLTSGYAENTVLHNGKLEAGVALLSKPYRRIDIARKLRSVLETDASTSSQGTPANR
ncbi:PAS domain-containing protein [Alkalilacustris brevis]|uniref:PAS domain-containing protein n=1 Tax=Alkalilacustris brevis TaxID=2026338 RepID=UPI00138FDD10|nr:PAS domain-containing protein [Alkalilacustris brevis]